MNKAYDETRDAALELPREQRLVLAHALLTSVVHCNGPGGPKITREEILRSAEEVLNGTAKTVNAFEALDALDRKYSRE